MRDFNKSPKYSPLNNAPAKPLSLADELREKAEVVRERRRIREENAFNKRLNSHIRAIKKEAKGFALKGETGFHRDVDSDMAVKLIEYFTSQGFEASSAPGSFGAAKLYISWA